MKTWVSSVYGDAEIGVVADLPSAGTALENPYVYDSAARDLKAMADEGLVEIVSEQLARGFAEPLIGRISFRRVR